MAKSTGPSKSQRKLVKLVVKELTEANKPSNLAQLAVMLASNKRHPDPRQFFSEADQLLIAAERYIAERVIASVEQAKTVADLRRLMPTESIGWSEVLVSLEGAVAKRAERLDRVEVANFLADCFPETASPAPGENQVFTHTQGSVFIHQLDGGRLSRHDLNLIIEKWRAYRKERTRAATEQRKKAAADRRKPKQKKKS